MSFSETLKELLIERGVSQDKLAKAIGYTQRSISMWINDKAMPKEPAVRKCAEFFGVSADYLIGLSDETNGKAPQKSAVKFTLDERKLIEQYRKLNAKQQKLVRDLIKTLPNLNEDE